jgi:hypothetical protein
MHRTFAHMIIIYLISLIRYIFYSAYFIPILDTGTTLIYYILIWMLWMVAKFLHQLIGGKHPIIYNFSIIPGAGLRKTLHSSSHIDIQ